MFGISLFCRFWTSNTALTWRYHADSSPECHSEEDTLHLSNRSPNIHLPLQPIDGDLCLDGNISILHRKALIKSLYERLRLRVGANPACTTGWDHFCIFIVEFDFDSTKTYKMCLRFFSSRSICNFFRVNSFISLSLAAIIREIFGSFFSKASIFEFLTCV